LTVVVAVPDEDAANPVLLATLTAPLANVAVPAEVVAGAENADDTAREMALVVVVEYIEAMLQ
jgi:hypothetical protein